MRQSVRAVRAVELAVADPERTAAFFAEVWHLTLVAEAAGSYWFRGTSAYHHILSIHPSGGPPFVRRVIYDAESRERVDQLQASVRATGLDCQACTEIAWPGGGYGFGFCDPTGRAHAVVTGVVDHTDDARVKDRPYKIAHVNFNEPDAVRLRGFFTDILGFRCVDHAGQQFFMNADSPDHSSIVICQASQSTLNHLSFEMPDLDSVMRGAGRLQDAGYPIEWGVGRHGAANNVFAYFAGPEEMPLEYTSDVLQIDANYPFNGPDYWKWPAGRLDQWGVTPPHTKRWKRIQAIFGFGTDWLLPQT